jgi:hypothetical protein
MCSSFVLMPGAPSITDAPDAADPERAGRLMAAVDGLVEVGMELVHTLHRDVTEGRLTAFKAAGAFERLSRAVRLTIMLAQRLDAGIDVPVQAGAAAGAPGMDAASASLKAEPPETFEGEGGERGEYRERGDLDESAWLTRPISALAARICADLGVPYDAALWEDGGEDIPAAHIISAHPREGGDPGFLSSGAVGVEKSLGPRLRGDQRWGSGPPRYRPP